MPSKFFARVHGDTFTKDLEDRSGATALKLAKADAQYAVKDGVWVQDLQGKPILYPPTRVVMVEVIEK
tara:strand:- start:205 stop:408 length:204 start_codon:yes stop_codon:yes gene_type:complete